MADLTPVGELSSQAALTATMRNSITSTTAHSELLEPHRSQRVVPIKTRFKRSQKSHEDIFGA